MWPDRMPIFFHTADVRAARHHLGDLWGGPGRCFDVAFANVTHGKGGRGFMHRAGKPRWGYSQFNILMNYMFLYRPEG